MCAASAELEHVGSAHTKAELGVLLERAPGLLENPAQGVLEFGVEPAPPVKGQVVPVGPGLFEGAGAVMPDGRDGPGAWLERTRGSCSRRWPPCSPRWASIRWAMRRSGTW
jgi:hypothetical protein